MKFDALLITFGCSWTYGVGVGYHDNMSLEQYQKIAWDESICNDLSFRGELSKKYNLFNLNFSRGGSSNQKQFRLARLFFSSPQWIKLKNQYTKIIVLWGITSIYRYELYNNFNNQVQDVFLTQTDPNNPISQPLLKYSFSHEWEVSVVATEMRFWNQYFLSQDINNIWFDTFNHHNYNILTHDLFDSMKSNFSLKSLYNQTKSNYPDWPTWEKYITNDLAGLSAKTIQQITDPQWDFAKIVNNLQVDLTKLFDNNNLPRDLMSRLCEKYNGNVDSRYHYSAWDEDTDRVKFLVNKQILNPVSFHPTLQGHDDITNMLSPAIEELL
jgi:hypothetical protein